MEELEAIVILNNLLGSSPTRKLIEKVGLAAPFLLKKDFSAFGLTPEQYSRLSHWETDSSWQNDLMLAEKEDIDLISFLDSAYPANLRKIPDFPPLLYVKGTLRHRDQRSLAVVGTRHPSDYGLRMTRCLTEKLSQEGFTIVSGLARGIDTAAHQQALTSGGRSLAVLGSGLRHIYPPENETLAEAIAGQGAIISEFPMETSPCRQNFPRRNRLISGISQGTLVAEAPHKSGALIAAERATQQGRALFTIPGPIELESFRGNHLLIKEGRARLIEKATEVTAHFEDLFHLPQ
ncbi:MAG: DNA-processing protein DprA [Chlamydiota bacterium]